MLARINSEKKSAFPTELSKRCHLYDPMTRDFFNFFPVDFRCSVAEEKPGRSGEGGERLKAENGESGKRNYFSVSVFRFCLDGFVELGFESPCRKIRTPNTASTGQNGE
jgi:hypothetical protein